MISRVRRTPYALLHLEDDVVLDIAALFRGEAPAASKQAQPIALAILTGERHRISHEELSLLMSVPADRWVDAGGRDAHILARLAEKGLLLSDSADPMHAALRERDEALSASAWNLYAAAYHYMTQWSGVFMRDGEAEDVELTAQSRAAAQALVAEHGPPPPPFKEMSSSRVLSLPGHERDGALYRALMARRTTRAFDASAPMALAELDTVLRYVFGIQGYARNAADVVCIKRTSPSGGGLHPVEAYPIVNHVEGVRPGLYHYNAHDHSLELLYELDPDEGRRMATSFMCGQGYFAAAQVSFVLTARFYRNHWKYRHHQKAYAGILMDAAHLSQTLYLVSASVGLGAFVTLAINGRDIEERLGLDGVQEGAIAMIGCGPRAAEQSPLELQFSRTPPT